jgi:hypothetical protein
MSEALRYHGFIGAPPQVARQLYALPQSVVRSTYLALLLESAGKADVRVFVRSAPDVESGEVRDWQGEQLGTVPERLLAAVWGSTGSRHGVTELLDELGPYSVRGGIPCPPTARGAFGHQLRRHERTAEVRAFVIS